MQGYVCGFAFSKDRQHVALVEKKRPKWQAGKLNGIGGKIEPGEASLESQVREFREEAGVHIPGSEWQLFCTITGPDFYLHFYRTFTDGIWQVRSMTDERIYCRNVDTMPLLTRNQLTVPNLGWLIPLALHEGVQFPIRMTDRNTDEANAA